jgi:hypothetical protein
MLIYMFEDMLNCFKTKQDILKCWICSRVAQIVRGLFFLEREGNPGDPARIGCTQP